MKQYFDINIESNDSLECERVARPVSLIESQQPILFAAFSVFESQQLSQTPGLECSKFSTLSLIFI